MYAALLLAQPVAGARVVLAPRPLAAQPSGASARAALSRRAALLMPAQPPDVGAGGALSRRTLAASLFAVALAPLPPAQASYTLYKAAQDERDAKILEGSWQRQGRDIEDADYQGLGARNDAERSRALKYSRANKAGTAGKFCAGQTSTVSPMMENLCVRIGSTKADRATQLIDQFGSAQQPRPDR